jgi:hypothetical protein
MPNSQRCEVSIGGWRAEELSLGLLCSLILKLYPRGGQSFVPLSCAWGPICWRKCRGRESCVCVCVCVRQKLCHPVKQDMCSLRICTQLPLFFACLLSDHLSCNCLVICSSGGSTCTLATHLQASGVLRTSISPPRQKAQLPPQRCTPDQSLGGHQDISIPWG